jgi:hypothetical protein
MAGHSLGTIRGTIEIDYNGAGVVRAIKDADNVKKSGDKLDGMSTKVLSSFGKFAKGALLVSGALGTVSQAVGVVAGVLATVGPLAAAAFAAAPGFILAYASAMVIAKVAVAGVGDAMSSAAEGGAKFDKAMKKLSPNAQQFVKAYQKVIPVLDGVKKSIQDAFFAGNAGLVTNMAGAIKSLQKDASGVSGEMGKLVANVVKVATSGKNVERLRAVLQGVQAFLAKIRVSIGPVVDGFLKLAAQAGVFGGTLGGKVANALATLASWLSRIDLAALFEKAMPIITALSGLFTSLMSIATSLFSVFNVDGANAAGMLGTLAAQLAAFLQSAEGQSALQALGQAMQAITGAAGQIFLALLQALAPAIVALAPGVGQLAGQIAGVLVPAINTLAPALQAVAGFLSENMGWIGPLAGVVVTLAGAYKVYAAATTAVAAAQAILQSKMVGAAAVWVAQKIAIIGSTAATVANAAVTGGAAVAAWIANTAAIVANRVAMVAGVAAMAIVRGAVIAWTAVQWLLNVALSANPIGLVVLAIAALVAGIIYAYRNSETFRNIVQAVWAAIKTAIAATVNWIMTYVWPVLQAVWKGIVAGVKVLWSAIKVYWNFIKTVIQTELRIIFAVVKAVWSGIVTYIRTYINLVRTIITTVTRVIKAVWTAWLNATKAVFRTVWNAIVAVVRTSINTVKNVINGIKVVIATIRNAFNNAKTAASNALKGLISAVRAVPGRVTGALGNLGSLLYSKGQAIIRGFINGIGSMIGAVKAKAKSVVSAVTNFLPGSPAKEGPLSGRGYVLLRGQRMMTDFAQGITNKSQEPRTAMLGAVTPTARATVPKTSRTLSGPSALAAATVAPGATRTYMIQVGDKTLAHLVVDALTGQPKAVAKATTEGNRRIAWAGSGR